MTDSDATSRTYAATASIATMLLLAVALFWPGGAKCADASIAVRLAAADAAKGRNIFVQCSICHVSKPGATTTIGPNLWNIVGRDIAAETGYDYSGSLKQIVGNWSFERLDVYLTDPKLLAPDGRMPFSGITSAVERAHLLAYLRTLSDLPVALPKVAAADSERLADAPGLDEQTGNDAAKWQGLPPGPGREDVFYRCGVCHSLMIVKQQGLSHAAWDESLQWMVDEQGMPPIEDENTRNRILDYLSTHFGLK